MIFLSVLCQIRLESQQPCKLGEISVVPHKCWYIRNEGLFLACHMSEVFSYLQMVKISYPLIATGHPVSTAVTRIVCKLVTCILSSTNPSRLCEYSDIFIYLLLNINIDLLCFAIRFHGYMLACVSAVFVGTMKTTGAIQLTTCTG